MFKGSIIIYWLRSFIRNFFVSILKIYIFHDLYIFGYICILVKRRQLFGFVGYILISKRRKKYIFFIFMCMLFNELKIISGRFDGSVKKNTVCSEFQMESICQWFLAITALKFSKFEEYFSCKMISFLYFT